MPAHPHTRTRARAPAPAQVIAAEKGGNWSEALSLYEQLLSAHEAGGGRGLFGGPLGAAGSDQGGGVGEAGAGASAAVALAAGSHAARGAARGSAAAGGAWGMSASGGPSAGSGSVGGGGGVGGGGSGAGGAGGAALQLGALRCLLHAGHLQALLRQVDGLLARLEGGGGGGGGGPVAGVRMQLAAMGVAASWRMGRWDLLQVRARVCPRAKHAPEQAFEHARVRCPNSWSGRWLRAPACLPACGAACPGQARRTRMTWRSLYVCIVHESCSMTHAA